MGVHCVIFFFLVCVLLYFGKKKKNFIGGAETNKEGETYSYNAPVVGGVCARACMLLFTCFLAGAQVGYRQTIRGNREGTRPIYFHKRAKNTRGGFQKRFCWVFERAIMNGGTGGPFYIILRPISFLVIFCCFPIPAPSRRFFKPLCLSLNFLGF